MDSGRRSDLVFKYSRRFALLTILGWPLLILLVPTLLGLAYFGIAFSDGGLVWIAKSVYLGLLGIVSGVVTVFLARQWYVPFFEYTLTDEGLTARFRSSSHFLAWGSLINARYRSALKQVDLEFEGHARRVILTNVDFDPEQAEVLRAVTFIESVTGRPVTKTKF